MVNEIKKVELTDSTGFPRSFTCADNVDIVKGTLLKLSDPRTVSASDGVNDALAGIASMDKDSDDTSTRITVWTDGVFDAKASGSITAGKPVVSAGVDNLIQEGDASDMGSEILGYALETAENGETINVRVRL